MTHAVVLLSAILWAGCAIAEDHATAEESKAQEQPAATAEPEVASEANVSEKDFEPPPGFVTKKRGDLVLYCMRDSTIGTRFKTEKCYDEAQIRDYLAAREENKRDIDRVRAICSNPGVCAPQ